MDINIVRIKWIKQQIKHLESISNGKINRYGNFRGNQPSKESQEDIDYSLAWLKNELVVMDILVCNKCNIDLLGGCPDRFEYKGYDAWCFKCDAPTNKVILQIADQEMTNFEKGEYDAVHGHDVQDNQDPDYYSGYGEEYSRQQNADALTTLQTIGL
tara:strand:- start:1076 stop:1546 length:471 start_codon:yes stop_codon:yes gene_type:complete